MGSNSSSQPEPQVLHGLGQASIQIASTLGEGSFATVLLGTVSVGAGKRAFTAAFKVAKSESANKVLEHEYAIGKSLKHDHLVAVLGRGSTTQGLTFLAMEYVPGVELYELIAPGQGLLQGTAAALEVCRQVLRAVRYLHDRNLVHGDLKPENVLISHNSRAKLCDFGFLQSGGKPIVSPGTLPYCPPEIMTSINLGVVPTAQRSTDIWAFGITFFCMLTGDHIWIEGVPRDLLQAHIAKMAALDYMRTCPLGGPGPAALLSAALAWDPNERPTVAQVQQSVEELMASALAGTSGCCLNSPGQEAEISAIHSSSSCSLAAGLDLAHPSRCERHAAEQQIIRSQ